MRFSAICLCLTIGLSAGMPAALLAQNDGAMQRFPEGVKESEYHLREPKGGPVSQWRIEPPNWWVGMQHPEVEVLLYDTNIRDLQPRIDYPGLSVKSVARLENPNYLFVTLAIGPGTQPGVFSFQLLDAAGKEAKRYPYELKARNRSAAHVQGLSESDLIYLIMPDRFANGDRGNDEVKGMRQTGVDRQKIFFRHGGDLMGVMERLGYLSDLGVTALWLNPVIENDQPYESYHGYAPTDHYLIDRRLGSNEQYRSLVQQSHERGMKVIMDVIFNHVGDQHWFIRDLPSRDWIHQDWPAFTRSNFRAPTWLDPYASEGDRTRMRDGWFDTHMPDLNQQQPQLANYLIQNSIWWAEYSGHDAYRIDTYSYPDQAFMSEWGRRVRTEFPRMGLFGEVWDHGPGVQAWFGEGNPYRAAMDTHLQGLTDFQLNYAIHEALNREQGWTEGAARLYYTLAQDYLYEQPYRNVTFLDNHDLPRFYSSMGENMERFKSGIALLLTLRGTPMLYYGTEILMTGTGGAFGEGGRRDFPGGWREDRTDKFSERGRTTAEQEAFNYVRRLAQYRRANPVLQTGRLTQFVPENNIYVYFRHDQQKTIMVVFNSGDSAAQVPTARYAERMAGYNRAANVITGELVGELKTLSLPAKGALVLELLP